MAKEVRIDRKYNARGINYRALVAFLKDEGVDLAKSFSVYIDNENSDLVISQGFEPSQGPMTKDEPEPTDEELQQGREALEKILDDDEPKKKPGRPKKADTY